MLKILLLIIICFVLSGCSVNYNIEIEESKIKESFTINDYISDTRTEEDILNNYNTFYPVYEDEISGVDLGSKEKIAGVNYYQKDYLKDNTGYHMNYSYIHDLNNYYRSSTLVYGYDAREIKINGTILTLQTKSMNNYIRFNNLENLTVNIKTNYVVLENNADNINDNIYTWYFNKNNNPTNRLIMKIDLSKTKEEEELKEKENLDQEVKSKYNIIIIAIVILIYLGFMIYIILRKNK